MRDYIGFRWSGQEWHIDEDGRAWFVDAQLDKLCCLNMQTGECDFIAQLPNVGTDIFMLNTRCMKVGEEIFCMPCYGDKIWIYNISNTAFQCVDLSNEKQDKLFMDFCWEYAGKLFCVSRTLGQIIAVDIHDKTVMYHAMNVSSEDTLLSCCVRVDTKIYCTSYKSNRIYQFDMDSKETEIYVISDIDEGIATMCFDGDKFWLCGYSKKIYVWDRDKNTVKAIENFPKQFGNYCFSQDMEQLIDCESERYDTQLFCRLEATEKYVWAIPYRTNLVLYIEKETFEVHVLPIRDEEETKDSLSRSWQFKYFWQYVRDGRYLGIFSLKNDYIYEIDTVELQETPQKFWLSDECLKLLWKNVIFEESRKGHKLLFERFLKMNKDENGMSDRHQNSIGEKIFSCLK